MIRLCSLPLSLALLLLANLTTVSLAADAPPKVGSGKLLKLSALHSEINLSGEDSRQQLVITGHYENGGVQDVTHRAQFQSSAANVARVTSASLLVPLADGEAQITAELAGVQTTVAVQVTGMSEAQPIHFGNDIMPILTKLGCNTGGCHGKADGQNGFKLSLLGFDAAADYDALAREGRGRRVLPALPERSLLLTKPTGALGHGGGRLMETDSAEYRLLYRWIESGLPQGASDAPQVVSIEVQPEHRLLALEAQQQLAVTAIYSDGRRVDVTSRAEFHTNNEQSVRANEQGLVSTLKLYGQGSLMIRYQGHVAVFRATMPRQDPGEAPNKLAPNGYIDEHVFARLDQLGLSPAELCTDGEFIRRVSIDVTGTLPTVEETTKFLSDKNPNKREQLVDDLLSRGEYAAYFTQKWADILRVRGGTRDPPEKAKARIEALKKKKQPILDSDAQRADAFVAWIRQSLADNKPYDQFVREILLTTGPTSGQQAQPSILWYLELKQAPQLVDDTTQAFLGTRIQCAQCHHHPYEKWSQEDYWGLAGYFARIQWNTTNKEGKLQPVKVAEGGRLGQTLLADPEAVLTDPQGRTYEHPQPLGGEPQEIPKDQDPRAALIDWMAAPDNPFFARALVNRYWGHFFGAGLVEPVDDMRVTNPPSNPELLDALAADFIKSKFDLKRLIRTICTSRSYQLGCRPAGGVATDIGAAAYFVPRRIPAEALLDAVDQVTGKTTIFTASGGYKFPEGTRAIELPDSYVSSYFLDVFGKPDRNSACECERSAEVTLAQRAHMLNGGHLNRKFAEWAVLRLADKRPAEEQLKELFLAAYAREPRADELATLTGYLAAGDQREPQQAWSDIIWAVLNTKEFLFNH